MRTLALLTLLAALALPGACAFSQDPPVAALEVDGRAVRIVRDEFGVPHVFAETARGVYFGNGYAVAQDRLVQMDRYRRQARGELAELVGPRALNGDRETRRLGYTEAEREAQVARLSPAAREALEAYAAGVNAYLEEIRDPDAIGTPHVAALPVPPRPWRPTDSLAIAQMMARRFGGGGGGELRNLQVYNTLRLILGAGADALFDDLAWRNDPASPPTLSAADSPRDPLGDPRAGRLPGFQAALAEALDPAALRRATAAAEQREALAYAAEHNLPTRFGSYAVAVHGSRTVGGAPVLVGGPQMGFGTPQIAHEVRLHGPEVDVVGMGFSGIPGVLIGHNRQLAWTTTTGVGDIVDVFVLALNPENPRQYRFNGEWRDLEAREETIQVRGEEPVTEEFFRSVHGPVLEIDRGRNRAYAERASYWETEYEAVEALLRMNRARNLEEFAAALPLIPTSHNWFAAAQDGDIGYWFAGRFPLRAEGVDPRLPTPGEGEHEWRGFRPFESLPQIVNPPGGVIANWNNKPAVWWDHGDTPAWGAIHRVQTIQDRLERPEPVSVADVRTIVRETAIEDERAKELLPLLLAAADGAELSPRAAEAVAYLRRWNHLSETGSVGKRVFDTYVRELRLALFGAQFGLLGDESMVELALSPSVLLRALQGPEASLPLKVDHLRDRTAPQVMLEALEKACAALEEAEGPEVSHWRWPQRWLEFRPLAPIPWGSRGTYIQIVELCRPEVLGESILPPGQSEDPRSPHHEDQRELAGFWRYKPLRLDLRPPAASHPPRPHRDR